MAKVADPAAVDAYIEARAEPVRSRLSAIRAAIREAAPEAIEILSYGMPTFFQGENLVHFAPAAQHIGLYPGGEVTTLLAGELLGYQTSKGTIQLPNDQELPLSLIQRITRWRVERANAKAAEKKAKKHKT